MPFECVLGHQPLLCTPPSSEQFAGSNLSTRDLKLCLLCKNLSPRFIDPFVVLRQVNPVSYKLTISYVYFPFISCVFPQAGPIRRWGRGTNATNFIML